MHLVWMQQIFTEWVAGACGVFVEWINRAGDYHQRKPKEHAAIAPNFLEFQKGLYEIPWESKKARLSNQTYKNQNLPIIQRLRVIMS